MSRRRRTSPPPAAPPRDELAIERARRRLHEAVARIPPERRALLVDTLERAAVREEIDTMSPTKKPPKKGAPPAPLSVRLPEPLLAALDTAAEQIARERPDMTSVGRADAVRVLLAEAMAARKIPIR